MQWSVRIGVVLGLVGCGRVGFEKHEVKCQPPEVLEPLIGDEALVSEFEIEWTTPNNARLRWKPAVRGSAES